MHTVKEYEKRLAARRQIDIKKESPVLVIILTVGTLIMSTAFFCFLQYLGG